MFGFECKEFRREIAGWLQRNPEEAASLLREAMHELHELGELGKESEIVREAQFSRSPP
jgi:predicted Fe-S protein YdhL (DUF1289 family)